MQYLFHASIPYGKDLSKVTVNRDEHGLINMTCDAHTEQTNRNSFGCACVNKLKSAINPITEFVQAKDSPTQHYGSRIKDIFENWDDVIVTVKETRGY